jgi:hypothetical protein
VEAEAVAGVHGLPGAFRPVRGPVLKT